MITGFTCLLALISVCSAALLTTPVNQQAIQGSSVTFQCSTNTGPIYWLFYPTGSATPQVLYNGTTSNGAPSRFSVVYNSTTGNYDLVDSSVQHPADAGTYQCKDAGGNAFSANLVTQLNPGMNPITPEMFVGIFMGIMIGLTALFGALCCFRNVCQCAPPWPSMPGYAGYAGNTNMVVPRTAHASQMSITPAYNNVYSPTPGPTFKVYAQNPKIEVTQRPPEIDVIPQPPKVEMVPQPAPPPTFMMVQGPPQMQIVNASGGNGIMNGGMGMSPMSFPQGMSGMSHMSLPNGMSGLLGPDMIVSPNGM